MFPDSSSERGQLRVKISSPEQTASGGGVGENEKVMGEGVEGLVECFGAVSSGREIETKDNEGRVQGKGRQNVVLSHNGPFQKTTKTGGGEDAGGASLRAFAVYEPVLGVPVNTRGIVEEALLDANKIPGGGCLEVGKERAYVCLSECAGVPCP